MAHLGTTPVSDPLPLSALRPPPLHRRGKSHHSGVGSSNPIRSGLRSAVRHKHCQIPPQELSHFLPRRLTAASTEHEQSASTSRRLTREPTPSFRDKRQKTLFGTTQPVGAPTRPGSPLTRRARSGARPILEKVKGPEPDRLAREFLPGSEACPDRSPPQGHSGRRAVWCSWRISSYIRHAKGPSP